MRSRRFTLYYLAGSAVLAALLWVAFEAIVPRLIRDAYDQQSFGFLNRIMAGRGTHSLESYLESWRGTARTIWIGLGSMAVALYAVLRYRIPERMRGSNDRPGGSFRGIYATLLLGWALFSYGFFLPRAHPGFPFSIGVVGSWSALLLAHSPLILLALSCLAWIERGRWLPWLIARLESHTDAIDALPARRIGAWIAAAAGLGLFAELLVIRLHGSYFPLFAYFKNVSLLSCFLGLGIGYTLAARRPLLTPLVMPALAVQVLLMHSLHLAVDGPLQNPVSEELAFGLVPGETSELVPVYGFLILIFGLNALAFLPLGQLASRLMARQEKLVAYGWNLVGSLLGIFLFYFLSYIWAPPTLWVLATALVLFAFLRSRGTLATAAASALLVMGVISYAPRTNERDVYSPYQKLTLTLSGSGETELLINELYFQRILELDSASVSRDTSRASQRTHYDLPYHLKPAAERVLVVGAGTGNDVAAAVRAGAGHVDAIEIDPAILHFGRQLHPERPYQQPNVSAVVDDARAFIRHAPDTYDLIVYGLLDSHTLLSGRAGVRLDSYVYTVEGFREARSRLREGGMISLTFSLLAESLGRKLYLMLQEAFDGQSPVVYRTGYDEGYAFLIGERMTSRESPALPGLRDVTAEFASSEARVDLSTDDWPFFYMPFRKYPVSYVLMIAVLLAVTWVFVRQVVPGSGIGASWPCFYLGAGFMLIETKGITELALVYGSTWTVIAVVITGILLMAFLANWIILRMGSPPTPVTYGLLLLSIVAGLSLTSARLSGMPPWLSGAALTGALTLPMFFSGFAFSSELSRSSSVAVALSSNLLGAMLGGFLEYNSMYFGFRSLYFLAIIVYALAFLTSLRSRPAVAPVRAFTSRA